MKNFKLKLISSYNKCFEHQKISDFEKMETATALKGDMFAFEACVQAEGASRIYISLEGDIAGYFTVREIKSVMVEFPVYPDNEDEDYLNNKQSGMYPDLLMPICGDCGAELTMGRLKSFWIEGFIPDDMLPGDYSIGVSAFDGERLLDTQYMKIEVIDAVLPHQELINTQWFHCDCLATYYGVEVFSEEHWKIIESFVKTAVSNGQNMLLTPVFTPPLDTDIGTERPTVQLVGVTMTENGEYTFDFSLVDRWFDMCDRCKIEYYEISHLFTQWGANYCPKIMATVDGEYKKIFGWDNDSLSDEYISFIKSFIICFKEYLKKNDRFERCLFHISDEPGLTALERYNEIKIRLRDVLEDCVCADALSNFEFYKEGVVKKPIVATNHIKPFLDSGVEKLWCYYCCGQHIKVSNRLIAMSMNRTRVIGMQFFKYDIHGFLQWGYNFYYSYRSRQRIDPYKCNDGGFISEGTPWVPAGDAFSVYPAPNGTAYESLHYKGFTQALSDLRAFRLAERLSSKQEVLDLIEGISGNEILFDCFPGEVSFSERVRFAVNEFIKERL